MMRSFSVDCKDTPQFKLLESRYNAILKDENSLLLGFSKEGIIHLVNQGFCTALNENRNSLLGTNLYELVFDEDIETLRSSLEAVKSQHSVRCDLRVNAYDRIVWQEWVIRGVYADNEFVEYLASGREISDVKLTRAQLQDGAVFRRLTEIIPVMIYVFGESNKFIYVNPNFEMKLGYSQKELLNMNFWDIVHPDHKEMVRERGMARLRGEDVPINYEIKALKKNGEIFWGDVFFSMTQLAGEMTGIVGAYDITERKRLELDLEKAHSELEMRVKARTTELRKANQELVILNSNLNNVICNMSDGVILVNHDGDMQILNPVFEQSWGTIILSWEQHIKKNLNSGDNYFLKRLLADGIAFQDEEFIVHAPSGQVHFVASGTPISDENGNISSGVIMVRPIEKVHRLVNRFSGARARFHFEDIISCSPGMLETIGKARLVSSSQSIILIEGESGTGKELFSHAIHNSSSRVHGPFVALNCAAIPRELIGTELFGYVEGAFTGARRGGSPGKFELASGGTLFLDEIGDMPFEQQAALLRVIQEKQLTRIGGNQPVSVDVRIICATNKDLHAAVESGNFRQDLYYRLNVINLKIPPLRERPEDIPLLLTHFLQNSNPVWAGKKQLLDPSIIKKLSLYQWSGNVRELENLVEKLLYTCPAEKVKEWLEENIFSNTFSVKDSQLEVKESYGKGLSIWQAREEQKQLLADRERQQIIELMQEYKGNVSRVAREMGMARSTLYKRMKNYSISN